MGCLGCALLSIRAEAEIALPAAAAMDLDVSWCSEIRAHPQSQRHKKDFTFPLQLFNQTFKRHSESYNHLFTFLHFKKLLEPQKMEPLSASLDLEMPLPYKSMPWSD